MVIIVAEGQVEAALESLRGNGEEKAFVMGRVTSQAGVQYEGLESWAQ